MVPEAARLHLSNDERLRPLVAAIQPAASQSAGDLYAELVESIISKKQTDRLSKRIEEGNTIRVKILFSLPSFWVGQFQRLERERHKFQNTEVADRLIERGRGYLQQNDVEGLTDVVRKLWALLPREEAEKAQRGIGGATIL